MEMKKKIAMAMMCLSATCGAAGVIYSVAPDSTAGQAVAVIVQIDKASAATITQSGSDISVKLEDADVAAATAAAKGGATTQFEAFKFLPIVVMLAAVTWLVSMVFGKVRIGGGQ